MNEERLWLLIYLCSAGSSCIDVASWSKLEWEDSLRMERWRILSGGRLGSRRRAAELYNTITVLVGEFEHVLQLQRLHDSGPQPSTHDRDRNHEINLRCALFNPLFIKPYVASHTIDTLEKEICAKDQQMPAQGTIRMMIMTTTMTSVSILGVDQAAEYVCRSAVGKRVVAKDRRVACTQQSIQDWENQGPVAVLANNAKSPDDETKRMDCGGEHARKPNRIDWQL